MAASHLAMISSSDLRSQAISHRVLALRGLNTVLSLIPKTSADVDALLAACYALAIQSSHIGDSVEEFLTMFRGCHIVIAHRWPERLGSAFRGLETYYQLHIASSKLADLPVIDQRFIGPARESLEKLSPLCHGMLEKRIVGQLLGVVSALETSSCEGWLSTCPTVFGRRFKTNMPSLAYFKYSTLCYSLSSLPDQEFRTLIDSSNAITQILLAHFAAALLLVYPIKSREWSGRVMGYRRTVFRIQRIYDNVPSFMQGYLTWPMSATVSSA